MLILINYIGHWINFDEHGKGFVRNCSEFSKERICIYLHDQSIRMKITEKVMPVFVFLITILVEAAHKAQQN